MSRVPQRIADQPRPTPPTCERWTRRYREYLIDLACWRATRGDRFLDGVEEEPVKSSAVTKK